MPGDAVGNQTLEIRRVLRESGYTSDIFAENVHESLKEEAKPVNHFPRPGEKDAAIYHFSIGTPLTRFVSKLPCIRVMYYHNITPSHFFFPYDTPAFESCERGRAELALYRGAFDFVLGASAYNVRELVELGYPEGNVVPYILNFSAWDPNGSSPRPDLSFPEAGKTHILFVGRVVPNKRYEDLVKVFYFYKNSIDPEAHLWLVGPYGSRDRYYMVLRRLIQALNLEDVHFTGHVSRKDGLSEYYRRSSVLLCMSEHEGFCIPLVEAMHFGLPVIAFQSTGVPDTMGPAGILFKEKKFEEIAELVHLVLTQSSLRQSLLTTQNRRLNDFQKEKTEAIFLQSIRRILDRTGKGP